MIDFKTRQDFFDHCLNDPDTCSAILLGDLKRGSLKDAFDVKERWARDAIDYVKATSGDENKLLAFQGLLKTKGRSIEELIKRFGDVAQVYLETVVPGYHLYTTRNQYGELFHILLKDPPEQPLILPQEFSWHQPDKINGLLQPYIMVDLPYKDDDLTIALLYDIHFGHKAHKFNKLLKWIKWVEETDNVYVILGGDVVENAIDDGRGMMYDQLLPPMDQLNSMVHLLSPIAHKIILSVPGNHEERTYKKTGIDLAEVLANRLGCPYVPGPTFLSVMSNDQLWNFHVWHGKGNSKTKGGKMNAAAAPKKFTNNIHFFISGHVHDSDAVRETTMSPNPVNGELMSFDQYVVIAPSFLAWEDTYAWKWGFAPPAMGGVGITLRPEDGDYTAYSV